MERQPKDSEKIISNKVDLLDIHFFITQKTTFQRMFFNPEEGGKIHLNVGL